MAKSLCYNNYYYYYYYYTNVILGKTYFLKLKFPRLYTTNFIGNIWSEIEYIEGGSNMTGTDLCLKKPHCAAAVRP